MFPVPDTFYAQWRLSSGAVSLIREDGEFPPESLLQAIWQHQRIRRNELRTIEGQRVRVLHPGFLSREGGPDFRDAVVQIDDLPPQTGDIEVDLRAQGWRSHGHDRNPAFKNVILHVIWKGDKPAAGSPPTLSISNCLDAPLGELSFWLNSEAAEQFPENLRGQCFAPLRGLPVERVTELLREAGRIRFEAKAAQLQARARQAGWEQALWEGIFRALGYKHNAWPMQCLAEHRTNWLSPEIFTLQARLLGISGLLPHDLSRTTINGANYLRRVWDQWWREREQFADHVLPRSVWRFHGQRPANHPQRRLALAAHWLNSGSLPDKLVRWCATTLPEQRFASSLLEILQVHEDAFWSWHWTLRSERLAKPQPLLGTARVTDLAVNVILPWLWIRAVEGRNQPLQASIRNRFHAWPAAENNSVLRLGRERLLGQPGNGAFRTAAEQQGLIQIVRDFCAHSNAVCESCRFPELVRNWQ